MTGTSPPLNLLSGVWETLDASKVWVFMVAGRVLSDYGARVALGDNNGLVTEYVGTEKGWGMSDGSPAGVSEFHALIQCVDQPSDALLTNMLVDDQLSKVANQNKDVMTYCIYTPGAGLEYKSLLISDASVVIAGDSVANGAGYVLTAPTDFTPNPCFRFSGYGLYAFGT
jgi:hypothetical protein